MNTKPVWRIYRSITIWLVAALLLQPGSLLIVPGRPTGAAFTVAPTMSADARTQADRLATAPQTIEISATSIQPEILEVTVGLTITLVNLDNRTRHIKLSDAPVSTGYRVYLPLVLRSAGGLAVQFPAFDAWSATPQADEVITLAAGQQVQRTMPTVGDVYVSDADNAALPGATVLVTPLALETDGSVVGQVKRFDTKAPLADATIKAVATLTYTITTDAQGHYTLPLPAGDYTLYVESFGFTFATRKITVQSFSPTIVDTIELTPADPVVTPIGAAGGTVTNSLGNTSVIFAGGAVSITKAVRLTDLPVDEFTQDFSSLPGPFTDGKIPLGFVAFEPEGVTFSAPVTWTIAYTGSLPVGSQLACYYWIEAEARWGDPVPSVVVDLGNGQKGLRAVLPHFSIYGHGAPPVLAAPPPPPPNPQPDPQNNPNQPDNDCPAGSQINLMTGNLCQTVGTLGLPTIGNLPAQITAKYRSADVADTQLAMTLAAPAGTIPDERKWRFEFAGRTFTGTGESVALAWNGLDLNGNRLAPGLHQGRFTTRWEYQTWAGWQIYETPFTWTVSVRRPDLSPFGLGWFGPHDTLLLDRGNTVSIVQGDGRFVQFDRQGNNYVSPAGEFSTLAHQADRTWTRTYPDGTVHTFNADGRLTRIADRYGNFQVILYESNGRSVPPGQWGLATRIRRITDSSGNTFDYSYDLNGRISSIADSAGRIYRYEHNALGQLTASIDPLGQRETFAYDAQGLMTSHTDRRGFTTQYVLDNRGRVITRSWPTGTALNMTYTPTRTAMTTDRGTPLITTLDQAFNPVAYYNGVYTITAAYNDDFQPERSNWPPRTTLYDAQGNVIASLGAVSAQFERNGPFDQVSRYTTNRGDDTRYLYDAAGNVTQTIDALGQIYSMAYDAHGQLLSLTDPIGNATTFNYTASGQLSSLTDPLSRTFQLNYNAAGNLTQITNPKSQVTKYEYDALNRLTAMVDALNGRTSLIYNADGELTRITDPTNRSINYTYDALNRRTSTTYADSGVERFGYDGWGNTTVFTDARGLRTTWQYDAANRPIQKQVQNGPTVMYSYDDLDQLIGVNEGPLTTTVTYLSDTVGRPLAARQTASSPLSVTLNYDYGYGFSRQANGVAANGAISTNGQVTTSIDGDTSAEQPTYPTQIEPIRANSGAQTALLTMASSADLIAQTTAPDDNAKVDPGGLLPYREERRPKSPDSTIFVGGTLLTDTTWISTNVYVLNNSVVVANNVTLTVETGTVVKGGFGRIIDMYGTLIADGTSAQPVIFTSPRDDAHGGDTNGDGNATTPAPGDWPGITVRAGGQIDRFNYVFVGYAGTGITFSGLGADTHLAIENSTFISNSQQALRLNLSAASGYITFTGNTAGGNAINAATIVGNVSNTLTLNGSAGVNLPFRLTGVLVSSLTVDPGAVLVLTPGTIIKGGAGQIIDVYGTLMADGTPAQPVVFTSPRDDAHGGDTNGDGYATTPAPNDWGGIKVRAGGQISRFRHVLVAYAGTGITFDGLGADTHLAIENSTFISNSQQALSLNLNEASGYITFTGNTASGNAINAASIVGSVSNTLTLNGRAEANLPFRLTGVLVSSLTIDPGAVLVLTPGTIIKGRSGRIIDVYGTLMADGTPAQPVVFTSPNDDAYGGDTNNDGYATGPAANDWGGIRFHTNSTGQLSNFLIAYASNGLLVTDATVTATNGSFIAHSSYAINNTTSTRIVTATTNYWGSATGPTHSSNPSGTGQRVTNGVLFTPWVAASPLPGGGRLRGIQLLSNNNAPQELRFTYDAIGQLTSLASSGYSSFALDYAYDADGRLTARTPQQNSPLRNTYRYDAASQLTQLAISNTTNLLLRESYTLDGLGNVSGVSSSRDGTITYTYDALNRLTGISSAGFNASYGYDAAGNRTSAGGVTYTYDAGGRLISASNGTIYGYDAAGNLTSRAQGSQTTTFTWDTQNRLVRIDYPNATYSAYQYDDAGRRISKRLPDGALIYYVYVGLNLAQELDSNGNVLSSYTYDGLDRPISMWRNGSTYFYLLDRLGSVVGLTDSNGAPGASYRYDPWGNVISSTGSITNPFRFTSREFDAESGLYFYRARYYDPQVGRFVSRDPIGINGGTSSLYEYVADNPTNYSDPSGLLFPGYNYYGSGTTYGARPVNRTDECAQYHDLCYDNAGACASNKGDPGSEKNNNVKKCDIEFIKCLHNVTPSDLGEYLLNPAAQWYFSPPAPRPYTKADWAVGVIP